MKWNSKFTLPGIVSLVILSGLLVYTNCGNKDASDGSFYDKPTPFVSVWQTTTANESITLPLREGFEYNMSVDWGDGSESQVTSWNDSDNTHEYAETGDHTITIQGKAEAWYFNACGTTPDTGSEGNIVKVTDLGNLGWKNLENAFCGCLNLTTFKGGKTSNVTTMAGMFWSAMNLDADIKDWDTSKVKDMGHMFDGAKVDGLDLRGWDTSSVTNMENMFIAVTGNPNIKGWDTSKVENMKQMFYLSSVNPVMSGWSFAKVTDMTQMLVGSQITTRGYTDFLKRLGETATVNGVELNATSQYYDTAASARASLVSDLGWMISDNGSAGPDPD